MGRPLHNRFFGNRNQGSASTVSDDGIGGEGIASIAVSGTFSGKTTGTAYAVTISAPQLPTGVQAAATITFLTASSGVVTVTVPGSGYTSAPIPTILAATGGGTGAPTLAATLTTTNVSSFNPSRNPVGTNHNAMLIYANVAGGGAVIGDIVKQVGSRRYLVRTAAGLARVSLVASDTPAAGQAYILATDSDNNTYWVTKLTARRVTLTQRTLVGSAYQFTKSAAWKQTAAVAGTTVKIDNA
jgi:hypothetical protein